MSCHVMHGLTEDLERKDVLFKAMDAAAYMHKHGADQLICVMS